MGGGRIRASRRAASPRRPWSPVPTSCRWTSRSRSSRASMGYSRRRPCCSIGARRSSSRRASAPMPSRGRRSHAIAAQAHAGPKKLATGGSPFEVPRVAARRRARGVVDGEELTLAAGDRASCRRRRSSTRGTSEDGVMLSVRTRLRNYSDLRFQSTKRPACAEEGAGSAPLTTISSTSASSSVRKSSMARSCAVRALSPTPRPRPAALVFLRAPRARAEAS